MCEAGSTDVIGMASFDDQRGRWQVPLVDVGARAADSRWRRAPLRSATDAERRTPTACRSNVVCSQCMPEDPPPIGSIFEPDPARATAPLKPWRAWPRHALFALIIAIPCLFAALAASGGVFIAGQRGVGQCGYSDALDPGPLPCPSLSEVLTRVALWGTIGLGLSVFAMRARSKQRR